MHFFSNRKQPLRSGVLLCRLSSATVTGAGRLRKLCFEVDVALRELVSSVPLSHMGGDVVPSENPESAKDTQRLFGDN